MKRHRGRRENFPPFIFAPFFWLGFNLPAAPPALLRDGPLEKLWQGEGNFRAARIFFRYQIPWRIFFFGHSMNIF